MYALYGYDPKAIVSESIPQMILKHKISEKNLTVVLF